MAGDVLAFVDGDGDVVAEYEYDAWGNCTIIDDDTSVDIATLNPIRYRGYYLDSETGYYYLQSRYYDPAIGRFISGDTIDVLGVSPTEITDKNLFSYCDNNPVSRADNGGEVWHIVAGAAIGAISGVVSSIVGQAVGGQEINWAEVGVSAASGALTGAITTALPGMGALATGLVHGTVGAVTHATTEVVNGRKPTAAGVLAAGVTSGLLAGGAKAVGNLVNKGVKIQKIGRLKASNHANNPQLGVKYQINKSNGRPTTRSIEFHYNHSHKDYKPHWQQNSWNPRNNSVSSMKHWTWWGKRI